MKDFKVIAIIALITMLGGYSFLWMLNSTQVNQEELAIVEIEQLRNDVKRVPFAQGEKVYSIAVEKNMYIARMRQWYKQKGDRDGYERWLEVRFIEIPSK